MGFTKNHRFVGRRIELHPGCDLWARGARFADIVAVDDQGTDIRKPTLIKVRMVNRRVRKLQILTLDRAFPFCVKCSRTMTDGEWFDRCENCADPS